MRLARCRQLELDWASILRFNAPLDTRAGQRRRATCYLSAMSRRLKSGSQTFPSSVRLKSARPRPEYTTVCPCRISAAAVYTGEPSATLSSYTLEEPTLITSVVVEPLYGATCRQTPLERRPSQAESHAAPRGRWVGCRRALSIKRPRPVRDCMFMTCTAAGRSPLEEIFIPVPAPGALGASRRCRSASWTPRRPAPDHAALRFRFR